MNLLNRYLQAVARLLPKARRDDIIAELRANILSQMEDREEALGRPLTEDEQAEILRNHGNPTIIAGRYREGNLGLAFGVQLIGPELFPFYRNILLLNMGITLLILFPVSFIGRAVFPSIFIPLVMQVTIITLIFSLLNRYKVLDKWDPRKLPELKAVAEDGPTGRNIFEFVSLAVGTAWLALTPKWPYLMLGPGALWLPSLDVKAFSRWPLFYGAIVALLCAEVVLRFFTLFRWMPRARARIADLVLRVAGVTVLTLLFFQGPHFISTSDPDVTEWANQTFQWCIAIAALIHLWRAGWLFFSLLRDRHQMLPARQY
jgi:hypothetical protein